MPRLLARVAPADWHWWIGCTHLAMQWRGMLLKPWKSMPSIEVRGTPLQEPWSKPLECAADSAFKGCIQSLCLKNMFQQFSWACKIWPFLGDGFVTLSYKVSLPDLVQRAPSIESPGPRAAVQTTFQHQSSDTYWAHVLPKHSSIDKCLDGPHASCTAGCFLA